MNMATRALIIKICGKARHSINKFEKSEVQRGRNSYMTVKSLAKDDLDKIIVSVHFPGQGQGLSVHFLKRKWNK